MVQTSAWAGCNAGYLFRDPCESTIIMKKKGCTFNTLRVALLIDVATAIFHLKEKLQIMSAPRPTDKGEELITTGFPVANNKYHTALDFYFNMISFPVKMQKSPFSNLQSVKLSSLVTSCTSSTTVPCWKSYSALKRFERISSSRSRDIQKSVKVKIQNKVALRQVAGKQVSFQDRKKENIQKFCKKRNIVLV